VQKSYQVETWKVPFLHRVVSGLSKTVNLNCGWVLQLIAVYIPLLDIILDYSVTLLQWIAGDSF
jgi:hypothetical protein